MRRIPRQHRSRLAISLGYILFLYSLLPIAPTFSAFLRSQNFLRLAVGMIGLATIFGVYFILKRKFFASTRKAAILVAFMVFFYASLFYFIRLPEERLHFIEYGILPCLLVFSLKPLLDRKRVYLAATLLAVAFGILDEVIQYFLPNRYFEWKDMGFNVLAVGIGMGFYAAAVKCSSRPRSIF